MKNIFKKVFYIILLILGFIGIANTVIVSQFSNINVGSVLPALVGTVLIILSFLKLWIYKDKPILKNRLLRISFLICILLLALSFVLIQALIISGTNSEQSVQTDYLIILGGAIKGETISLSLKERLDKGVTYLEQYPNTKVIVTGGKGFEEDITEAEAMKKYLVSKKIPSERILLEEKATSTVENFKYSRELLENLGGVHIWKVSIITNDFHMYRSKMLAKRIGFEPYGIPCVTPISVLINSYLREYFALINSFLFDR